MSEPPLSRFGGQNPKPRPTHTLIVPGVDLASAVVGMLLLQREIFTVEPSPTQDGVWHLGVFESGKDVIVRTLQAMGY